MKDLYSMAINGVVVAENMGLDFAAFVTSAIATSDQGEGNVESIEIQRVSKNDE